jgi:septal ring factor EnvC (AmiA/AmiB activator)
MSLQGPAISEISLTHQGQKPAKTLSSSSLVEDAKHLERLQATRTEWRTKLAGIDAEIAAKQKEIRAKVEGIGKR